MKASKANAMENMLICNLICTFGIPTHVKGYQYLQEAIFLIQKDPDYLTSITKSLYIDIAKNNNTTVSGVERAMRHAINFAWESRGHKNKCKGIKDNFLVFSIKPSNRTFIAAITEQIRFLKL